jgi:hypothetical protein
MIFLLYMWWLGYATRNCCAASEYQPKYTDVSSGTGVDGGAEGFDVVIVI